MKFKRTVLVLGAGASKPYGFPLGVELKEVILNKLGNSLFNPLAGQHGFAPELVDQFKRVLWDTSAGTIDELMEKKPRFRDIGARHIAAAIAHYENEARVFPRKDWYDELYRQLDFESTGSNAYELGIVTLNYDRSLEYFLDHAIEVDCSEPQETTAHEKRKRIKIVHTHGSLGRYPEVPYPIRHIDESTIRRAAESIKVVSDHLDESPEVQDAQKLIADADCILFIGFGYDERTLKRLIARADIRSKRVHCACYHLNDDKIAIVRKYFGDGAVGEKGEDANSFLRKIRLPMTWDV